MERWKFGKRVLSGFYVPRFFRSSAGLLILIVFSNALPAQVYLEKAAVKTCIQQLFSAMRSGDSTALRAVFHPDARMQTVWTDDQGAPQIRPGSVDAFVQQIGSPHEQVYDERIRSYRIEVDGLLATAWTDYTFYLGEQLRHCGTNAFQLFKSAQGWKITQIIDTRYREACEPIPAGMDQVRMDYEHPIPFAPRHYICQKAVSEIIVDGRLDEADWVSAAWTDDFVDIEGSLKSIPPLRTRAKMLWDDNYFYFAAQLEEPHIWATLTDRDAVIFNDDDFEIFIDPDGDGQNYYEYEMNAHNTIWDLLMLWPYHIGRSPNNVFNWNNPGLISGVHIEGTLNNVSDEDQYWTVEVAFPWSALKELAAGAKSPQAGEQWRVNFSRVDWHMDLIDGKYVKQKDPATGKNRREENWVWSPTGRIDMHRPETWGYVQFSDTPARSRKTEMFEPHPEEAVKWALWQLFYQQRQFLAEFQTYTADPAFFSVPEVQLEHYTFAPVWHAGEASFEISAPAMDGKRWHINEMGRIWKQ